MTMRTRMTAVVTRIRDALTRNLGLKVISLVLAALLHLVVQRDSVRDSELSVPLLIQNVPKGKVFVGQAPESLKLRVRGRRGAIQQLLREHPARVTADLSAYRDSERHVFDPRALEVQLQTGQVEVLGAEPPSLLVRLDTATEAVVPIEVPVSGEPAAGFRVGAKGVQVDPPRVKLIGPQSQIRQIRSVRTGPLDLHDVDHDVRALLRLIPPGDAHVQLAVDEVVVEVTLEEREIQKTLEGLPIAVRGCPQGQRCALVPAEASVRVEGMAHSVRALLDKPPANLVYADVAGSAPDSSIPLAAHGVAGLTLTVVPSVAKWTAGPVVGPKSP